MKKSLGRWMENVGKYLQGKTVEKIDLKSVQKLLLHEEYQKNFEVTALKEKPQEWILEVTERKDRIPQELWGKEVVFNGFKERVEVIDFPFVGKPLYLHLIRRRWKEKGQRKSYSNSYELHPKGMKATAKFGNFLKGLSGPERRKFFRTFKNLRHIREEDF